MFYPRLHWAHWNGLIKFEDVAIADADWYCMGCCFVLVDGGQSTSVQFVAGDQQIKAA